MNKSNICKRLRYKDCCIAFDTIEIEDRDYYILLNDEIVATLRNLDGKEYKLSFINKVDCNTHYFENVIGMSEYKDKKNNIEYPTAYYFTVTEK